MNAASLLVRPRGLWLGFPLLAIGLVAGWLLWPQACFRGYWLGLMFWSQLSIGSAIVLLLLQLTGGRWGVVAAPLARASMTGFLALLPLFIPVLFALPHLFSWTEIRAGLSAPDLVRKQVWLNQPFFIVRTLIYLAAITAVVLGWRRTPPPRAAGPVLVLFIIAMSLFCADWMMSLQPSFYSSLYPFMYFSGAMVSTFAVLTGTLAWLQLRGLIQLDAKVRVDFGKLLFASVLFWGYIQFSQFIIVWTGNLPDEAQWYIVRGAPAWLGVTLLVVLFHFAVPFCLLLSQRLKKQPRRMLALCTGLFALHFVEVLWMMRPAPGEGFNVSPFDLIMPLLIGAVWLWLVLGTRPAGAAIGLINAENAHE